MPALFRPGTGIPGLIRPPAIPPAFRREADLPTHLNFDRPQRGAEKGPTSRGVDPPGLARAGLIFAAKPLTSSVTQGSADDGPVRTMGSSRNARSIVRGDQPPGSAEFNSRTWSEPGSCCEHSCDATKALFSTTLCAAGPRHLDGTCSIIWPCFTSRIQSKVSGTNPLWLPDTLFTLGFTESRGQSSSRPLCGIWDIRIRRKR